MQPQAVGEECSHRWWVRDAATGGEGRKSCAPAALSLPPWSALGRGGEKQLMRVGTAHAGRRSSCG